MGNASDYLCYNPYCGHQKISSRESFGTMNLFDNRNSRNHYNNIININNDESIEIIENNIRHNISIFLENYYRDDGMNSSHNIFNYDSNNNDDKISQLESKILENVDNLSPDKKSCIICLENFQKSDIIINLECLHMYHDNCIKKWLNENNYCPICKNKV